MAPSPARPSSNAAHVSAFVAGATGYTGREVVRVLAERGARTVAHVRPDSPRRSEWERRFAAVGAEADATPWEEGAMTGTLARVGATHVFALLGTTRARAKRAGAGAAERESYEAVDYGLTALLLRAALACGTRPAFVYLSAIGARAEGGNEYLRVRGRIERELERSGLPFVIARPAIITGADREEPRPLERVAAVALDAVLGVASAVGARRLRARYHSMTGAQLAAGLVRLALDASAGARVVADAAALREAGGVE